ncbi:MAG: hypothetical protein ACYTEG_03530 [Planctomycetota bacterium]
MNVLPEAMLGVVVGLIVHCAITSLPACVVSFASPLLPLLMVLIILTPAVFLRASWQRATAFTVSYAVALLASGLPSLFAPWGA